MSDDQREYEEHLDKIKRQIVEGAMLLDDNDKLYLLDKVDEARWETGATYNRGVHILMNVIQYLIESSCDSPNKRL